MSDIRVVVGVMRDLEHFADGVQEGCGRLSACELPMYEPPVRTLDMLFDDLEEA